jgi:formate hydrogenlyase subunit 3/multisubunit Na+/H+ antiporter MnhD subunit
VTFKRFVCIVLLVALTAVLVRPARAEAMDPQLILIIVGAGIAVVALIAVVIIANASEGRRRSADLSMTAEALEELERRSRALLAGPALVAIPSTAVESP